MSDLSKVRVCCTTMMNRLVIARFGKDQTVSLDQRDAEKEIMVALRDYMMNDAPKGAVKTFSINGDWYELQLKPCVAPVPTSPHKPNKENIDESE